ncbi:hypothetical protein [Massilia phosphatilytica]
MQVGLVQVVLVPAPVLLVLVLVLVLVLLLLLVLLVLVLVLAWPVCRSVPWSQSALVSLLSPLLRRTMVRPRTTRPRPTTDRNRDAFAFRCTQLQENGRIVCGHFLC